MKVRIPKGVRREQIFLYRLEEDTEKGSLVRKMLEPLNIPLVSILPQQLGQTVGFIAGYPGYKEKRGVQTEPVPEYELVLMDGLSSERVDQVLAALRGVEVPLKAMVTPYNLSWAIFDLLGELCKEREEIRRRNRRIQENR